MMRPFLLMLFLWFCCSPAFAEWGPGKAPHEGQRQSSRVTETDPLQQIVRLFQRYISPVDGARCRMYPTCSAYSRQALGQHGPFLGLMMTVDRLYRESDPIEQREPIKKWGIIRYYDPLENNDVWWSPQKEEGR